LIEQQIIFILNNSSTSQGISNIRILTSYIVLSSDCPNFDRSNSCGSEKA
jgi:hypothetical protein